MLSKQFTFMSFILCFLFYSTIGKVDKKKESEEPPFDAAADLPVDVPEA